MAPDSPKHLALVRRAASAWRLEATEVTLVSHAENLVYRVNTASGESVALRLHRPGYHTLPELRSEQMWTSALNRAGIQVPVGRALADGEYYREVVLPQGERRYAGVVEWLEGVPLWDLVESESDTEVLAGHYRTVGGLAARIHNQAAAWTTPAGFGRHHLDADGFMGEHPFWGPFWDLPELTVAQRDLIQRTRHYIYETLTALDRSPDHYSMIHADLHAGNLLVDGARVTVIDFDDAGFGWHIYEMAVTLFYVTNQPVGPLLRDAFVEGYRSARALTDETLALLPVFDLVRALALLGWIHHRREVDRTESLRRLITRVVEQAEALLS